MAKQFGVSRTPIREALRELGARGLIDLIPRRGSDRLAPFGQSQSESRPAAIDALA